MSAPLQLHASTVAVAGRGVLILGAPGSGKSTLALALMAFGARLVADDITLVTRLGPGLEATAPDAIRGRIEAWGVGLLRAETEPATRLALAVDLDVPETDRLPPARSAAFLGCRLPLVHGGGVATITLAPAVLQHLRGERDA